VEWTANVTVLSLFQDFKKFTQPETLFLEEYTCFVALEK